MTEEEKNNHVNDIVIINIYKSDNFLKRCAIGLMSNICEVIISNYLLHAFKDIESYNVNNEKRLIYLKNVLSYGK